MEHTDTAVIRRTLQRRCAARGIPVSGTFELTPRCNLSCKMCYIRLSPEEMSRIGREVTAEEWIALARDARDAGLLFLLITGGEPTLRKDFPYLYEEFVKLGLSISINTNGTLLTPEIRSLWHRLPPAQVNITLYGTSAEDYAALCGNGDVFRQVTENIEWLQSEGILLHLNTTLTPQNRHRLDELEAFAAAHHLDLQTTTYCFPPVRRADVPSSDGFSRLSPEEAAQCAVRDIFIREGIEGITRRIAENAPAHPNPCESDQGDPIRCLAGHSQFWITWDGRMLPCGMLDNICFRPFSSSFTECWKQLHEACASIRLCPDCVSCPDRDTCLNCAAVVYTETGTLDGRPDYMCRLNRAYKEELRTVAESFRK